MEKQRVQILGHIRLLSPAETREDLEVVDHLKQRYNETAQAIYHDTPGILSDIMDVFPSDIWMQIIQEALPSEHYASALLMFTLVSSKWSQAIISTPILWAHIEIRGSDDDSLAIIQMFAHLSRGAKLSLTLYIPLLHDPMSLHLALARMGGRIRRVVITRDGLLLGGSASRRKFHTAYSAGIKALMQLPQYVSDVTEIDLGYIPVNHLVNWATDRRLDYPLPPLLQTIKGWCFCAVDLQVSRESLRNLEEIITCVPFQDLLPSLRDMVKLRRLVVRVNYSAPSGTLETPNFPKLPNLTAVSFTGGYQSTMIDFLGTATTNLLHLEMVLPYWKLSDLLKMLRISTRLRSLLVRISDLPPEATINPVSAPPIRGIVDGIPTLRTLSLTLNNIHPAQYVQALRVIQHDLLPGFSSLYRQVEQASFSLWRGKELMPHVLDYLAGLPNLRSLQLNGIRGNFKHDERQKFELQALEDLDCKPPLLLCWLRVPQLQYLKLTWDHSCSEAGFLTHPNVRSFRILLHDNSHRVEFPPGILSALTKLTLDATGNQSLRLCSFPYLTVIIITSGLETTIATSLCASILYQPEDCPSLCDIQLLKCAPEWDMLFLMLEKRNFLTTSGVSRITRITLPFVPCALRIPLAHLLRGLYASRPSNKDLSFQGVVALVFDGQISGCRSCLRNMMGPCDEPIFMIDGDSQELEDVCTSFYSSVNDPPPSHMDPDTVEWIHQREMYALGWRIAVDDLGPLCWRQATCLKLAGSATVEITEHDAL